jgi:hypothetical protein
MPKPIPTIYPTSLPVEQMLDRFWMTGPAFDKVRIRVEPPEVPLAILKQLGSSPFERGGFPVIGFLATTYERVSRYALERARRPRSESENQGVGLTARAERGA